MKNVPNVFPVNTFEERMILDFCYYIWTYSFLFLTAEAKQESNIPVNKTLSQSSQPVNQRNNQAIKQFSKINQPVYKLIIEYWTKAQ